MKALKNLLRAMVKHFSDWERYLDNVLFAYRNSFHPSIKDTPFFINHGRDAIIPGLVNVVNPPVISTPNFFSPHIDDIMRDAFKFVRKNLVERQQQLFADSATLPNYYTVGDLVYVYSPVVHKDDHIAFHKFWSGPFKVIEKVSPVVFKVQHCENTDDIRRVYVSRLKPKN